jgi:asparagine synthase (glutamine-hydrolysing)
MPFHDIEIHSAQVVDSFHELNRARDEPIADIAGHGYWALAQAARESGCPVMLQGQGADELFWGYPWVARATEASIAKERGLDGLHRTMSALRSLVPEQLTSAGLRGYVRRVGAAATGWAPFALAPPSPRNQLVFWDTILGYQAAEHAAPTIYGAHLRDELRALEARPAACFTFDRPWGDIDLLVTRILCDTYLRVNGLCQGDRLFMASSVELRIPLVDYRLVETVIGLRKGRSDRHLHPKAWFKAAIRDLVPEWIMSKPKVGFSPPTLEWMRRLREAFGSTVRDGYLVEKGFLEPAGAAALSMPHSRLTGWGTLLFKALVLESWCRTMSSLAAIGGGPTDFHGSS